MNCLKKTFLQTKEDNLIRRSDNHHHFSSAASRFLKPLISAFFAESFPKLFGPNIRNKIADELVALFESYCPEAQRLKPGQILWAALDKNTRGDSPNRKFVPVVLTVVNQEDIDKLVNNVSRKKLVSNAIARMIYEAYDQGGILSTRDIGLLTLRDPSYVSILRIYYETQNNLSLPHTGALHDMGSTITHKAIIIRKIVSEKKDPAVVARESNHSQKAVDHYLKDFYRVRSVYNINKDINYIALITDIAPFVVKQYIEIINENSSS